MPKKKDFPRKYNLQPSFGKNTLTCYLLGGWREERDADQAKAGSIWCWGAIAKFEKNDNGLNKKHILYLCAFHAIQIYVK